MSRGYRLRHLSSRFLGKKHLLRLLIILMYVTALGVALFYGYRHNGYGLFQAPAPSVPAPPPLPLSVPIRPDPPSATDSVDLEEVLSEEEDVLPKERETESDLSTIFRHQEEGQATQKAVKSVKVVRRSMSGRRQARPAGMKKVPPRKKPFRLTGHQV